MTATSNGKRVLPKGMDGRSTHGRRLRAAIVRIAAEHGGVETLTEPQLAMVRLVAMALVGMESLQARGGDGVAAEQLAMLSGEVRRLDRALRQMMAEAA